MKCIVVRTSKEDEKLLAAFKILLLAYLWFVLPVLVGRLWGLILKKEHDSGVLRYLLGMVTMWAVFFALARYEISAGGSLSQLSLASILVSVLLSLAAIGTVIIKNKYRQIRVRINAKLVAEILIAAAVLAAAVVFSVDDPEDHVTEEVLTMYTTDSLYAYNPMNGKAKADLLSLEAEELTEQANSPVSAAYAVCAAVTKIHPAKLVRLLLPVFLLPFYYCVYAAWGSWLFPESEKKQRIFRVVVWLLLGTSIYTEHAVAFGVFANCWNGETLFFLGLLPAAVLLLLGEKKQVRELEDFRQGYLLGEYIVCAAAGQLLYGKGFFFVTFAWGIALIAAGIKRWKDGSSHTVIER
jgi:hypothetical protein